MQAIQDSILEAIKATRTNTTVIYMKRLIYIFIFLFLSSCSSSSEDGPYSDTADPQADYNTAAVLAKATNRNIMLIFGANWCPDCREFDQQLKSSPLKELIDTNYVTVKVNVGDFDENMDFVSDFDNPVSKGIPSIVITDSDKQVYFITKARELSSIRNMKKSAVIDFFQEVTQKNNKGD